MFFLYYNYINYQNFQLFQPTYLSQCVKTSASIGERSSVGVDFLPEAPMFSVLNELAPTRAVLFRVDHNKSGGNFRCKSRVLQKKTCWYWVCW